MNSVIITTSFNPPADLVGRAEAAARFLGGKLVPRRRDSLQTIMRKYQADQVLLVTKEDMKYIRGEYPPVYFHPSMAHVRVQRLMNGESDTMVTASGAEPGDVVIDCTAGLASDSIVFSHVVGDQGRVIAIDSEPAISLLLREGLSTYTTDVAPVNEAMRRIEVVHADHLDYLRRQADQSADIIYFDPMFREPLADSSSMSPLRGVANPEALLPESIAEARRVARKSVIMKEARASKEFARLGFTTIIPSGTKLAYGVIRC